MKTKKAKLGSKILVLGMALTMMLSACGSNDSNSGNKEGNASKGSTDEGGTGELKHVDLTWYFDGAPQADVASVEAEMNKILKEKINVTLHLKAVDWGSYDQKMQLVNASNEEYDLAFTSSWANNYFTNVSKGAFIPISMEMLEKYAPNIMKTIPSAGWDAVKVKGDIFAVPNYQIWAMTNGIAIQKDIADKYGFDPTTVKKYEDLEPLLQQVKDNEPGLIPFENDKSGRFGYSTVYYGLETLGGALGVIKTKEDSLKVYNMYETEEYASYLKMIRDWYLKGYIRKDAATVTDTSTDRKAGKPVVVNEGNVKPGGEVEMANALGGKAVVDVKLSEPYLQTTSIIATMTGISRTSKNPERALMLLDLMFGDKELYNLMAHGIEGKHYKKIDENTVETIKDGGYDPNTDWIFGNQLNSFYRVGQQPGTWEETIKVNESAKPSPLLGFNFDPTPVKSEIAQVSTVTTQYSPILETGSVDIDKMLAEFQKKLKAAGAEKIIAEQQKQIDEWKASNGQ